MENNPTFPTPPAALAELKKVLPEFQKASVDAQGRDKKMVSIKNDKKAIMQALLQELSEYVTVICKDDRTLMLSSGFDVTRERIGNSQEPSIEKLEVKSGEPGVAILRIRKVKAVKAYIHQYTTEPPGLTTAWVQEGSSDGNHTFSGLTSEKRHWFRVIAIGFNKQKAASPIVSLVIQ
jgi:esterase/lipase superfamily enzyme